MEIANIARREYFPEGGLGLIGAPARGEAVPNENYEPMMPSVTDSGLRGMNIAGLGSTQAGRMWALKALHPNGENVTSSAGIPDHTHVPVVTAEYRTNVVVSGVLSSSPTIDDMDIIVPPVSDVALLYRRYRSGTTPVDNEWIPVFWPAFTKVVSVGEWEDPDDGESFKASVSATDFGKYYSRARAMYKGVTLHLDAPALFDQGRLVAGQMAADIEASSNDINVYQLDKTKKSVTNQQVMDFAEIPLTEDDLFQATPGAVAWEARHGVYLPMRFREPVHNFNNSELVMDFEGSSVPGLYSYKLLSKGNDMMIYNSGTDAAPKWLQINGTAVDNLLTGIILVRGISSQANIQMKARAGVEAQAKSSTPISPFQHASPRLDRLAIDMVTEVAQATAMAYPAKYNDLGGILDIIKKVVGGVKGVGGVIRDLGLPVVSDLAGGVTDFLGGIGLSPSRRRLARSVRRAYFA